MPIVYCTKVYPFYSDLFIVRTEQTPRKFIVIGSTETTIDDASIITINKDIRSKLLTVIRTCQYFHFSIKVISRFSKKLLKKGSFTYVNAYHFYLLYSLRVNHWPKINCSCTTLIELRNGSSFFKRLYVAYTIKSIISRQNH